MLLNMFVVRRYRKIVTANKSWGVVVLCWVMASVLGSVPLLGWNQSAYHSVTNHTSNHTSSPTCTFINVMSMSYMVFFNFLGCILLPMLCTGALYAYIFHRIHKRLQHRDAESSAYYHRERNLASSLLLVLFLFGLCWLPIHLLNIAHYAGRDVPKTAVYVAILLSHANSAVNPVVYAFKVPKIEKVYSEIWRRYILGCGNQVPSGSSPENTTNLTPCSNQLNTLKLQHSREILDCATDL